MNYHISLILNHLKYKHFFLALYIMNDDTSLIWEFLNLQREQQRLATTIIHNESIGLDRSYNLLLSHLSRERTRNLQRSRSFRDTMTGILWDELTSDPS